MKSSVPYEFIEETLLIKELQNEETGIRYILCYNPIAAWDEYSMRQAGLDQLKKHEGHDTKTLLKNRLYRSYITSGLGFIKLDKSKIREAVRYDGRYVLKTNCDIPKEELSSYYKMLINVERCFHELKGVEKIAPVYHWTEKRVRAHVFICFLSLLLWQTYVEKLKAYDGCASPTDVWREIVNLHSSVISAGNNRYLVREASNQKAQLGFRACGVAFPPRQIALPTKPITESCSET